jgi:CPA1 family monovalent cation:H+ antiporter
MVLGELKDFTHHRLASVLGRDVVEELEGLIFSRQALVEKELNALQARYPDFAPVLQYQYLNRAALQKEEADFDLMHAESVISEDILNDLRRDLERRRRATATPPKLDLGLRLPELIGRVPLFQGLSEERLTQIARLLSTRLALPDEVLVHRGDRGGDMFFIAGGGVEVVVPGASGGPIFLHTGDFFGEMALITRQPRTADVRAVGYTHLLVLDARDFRKLIEADEELRRQIMETASQRRAVGIK